MIDQQQTNSKYNKIRKSISQAVGIVAREINANIIVTLTRKDLEAIDEETTLTTDIRAVVFKRTESGTYLEQIYETQLLKEMDSLQPIKDLLRDFVTKKILLLGDRVICVGDDTLGVGFSGLVFVLDIDEIFFKVSTHKLTENVDSAAFESIVNIALELAKEGREGKKIGTAFVIANLDEIKPYLKQLIFNPFLGYAPEHKRIQDPKLKETMKEFSQLDGIFVIDRDGTVISAGTYIDIDTSKIDVGQGFGTKHRCCAAITRAIPAIALVLSESGVVRIMKDGKIVARLN